MKKNLLKENLQMRGGESMKRITKIILLCAIAVFLTAGSASAALIGIDLQLPDIYSDSTGTYSYNSATDLFSIVAKALTITFDGVTTIPITLGSYSAQFLVDSSGNFSSGVSGDDLSISGTFTYGSTTYSGVLLTGEITNFGWLDVPGPYAFFDYTFNVTGGSLASYFGSMGGSFTSAETSTFNGLWDADHAGNTKVKTDTASVPEPGTLLLLGSGLVGLAFYGRFRRRK